MATGANAKRLQRSEVPLKQTWDLRDLFTTNKEWENELAAIQLEVSVVTEYKGKLGTDAETLLNCLATLEKFQQRIIRAATYASLRASADGADPKNQADASKVSATLAKIGAELSFVDSELLTLSSETINRFLQEKPELRTYQKMLDDLLEKKHIPLPRKSRKHWQHLVKYIMHRRRFMSEAKHLICNFHRYMIKMVMNCQCQQHSMKTAMK